MPLKNYGVLKGTVIGHLRDADDDHYQILVKAGDGVFRIAFNVMSGSTESPSTVLFATQSSVPDAYKSKLVAQRVGQFDVKSRAGGLALDFVRAPHVPLTRFKPLPPDQAGDDNDLKDKVDAAVVRAMGEEGSIVYALGERWGPEKNKADQYFRFQPGNGIHDIHMNQGNVEAKYKKFNGVFQDGALIFQYPGDKWLAIYIAFQGQSFQTDDKTGNAVDGTGKGRSGGDGGGGGGGGGRRRPNRGKQRRRGGGR